MEESDSESDDDDEPKGGRKIPLVELVKGFIPRLLRPEPQEWYIYMVWFIIKTIYNSY